MASNKKEQGKITNGKAKRRRSAFVFILSAFIFLLAGAGYIGYKFVLPLYSDVITQGVRINGVDVSGKTYDEAVSELTSLANQRARDVSATVRYGDRIWQYGAMDLGAGANIEQVVASAMEVARTGNVINRYREVRKAQTGAYQFDASLTIHPDNLIPYIQDIKAELDESPVEPTMKFESKGDKFTIDGHSYWRTGVDYSPLFITTPGENGMEVDVDATMERLRADLEEDYIADVELVVHDVAPKNTEESLRDSAVLLYHSSSKLRSSTADRTWNIKLALSNFDGVVIAPGQEVSYNEILGERTVARGYRKAGTIASTGALVDDVGGGICQASTVLFNAVIHAGCEIIERNPHSWPLYWQDYDWGLDAMVNWGSSDLKFRNTTGGNLYIDFYLVYSYGQPSHVDIDIYGPPIGDGMTIRMQSVKVSETPPPPPRYEFKTPSQLAGIILNDEWTYDPKLNLMVYEWVKPRTGYAFDIYRLWMKGDQEVKREKLYTSTYRTIQGVNYTKALSPDTNPSIKP